jgi:hypothetical protein
MKLENHHFFEVCPVCFVAVAKVGRMFCAMILALKSEEQTAEKSTFCLS